MASAAAVPSDPDAVAAELPGLRAEEADLPWDSPAADALWHTARLAGVALRRSHPEVVFAAPTRYNVSGVGPVIDQWRKGLRRVDDAERNQMLAAPPRRLARLLVLEANIKVIREQRLIERAEVAAIYRDAAGRLVVDDADPAPGETDYTVERPTELPVGWGTRRSSPATAAARRRCSP